MQTKGYCEHSDSALSQEQIRGRIKRFAKGLEIASPARSSVIKQALKHRNRCVMETIERTMREWLNRLGFSAQEALCLLLGVSKPMEGSETEPAKPAKLDDMGWGVILTKLIRLNSNTEVLISANSLQLLLHCDETSK